MNAGLPGTGIGGFFYLLCAIIMPFIELYYTLKGRSSWKRWRLVLKQLFIATGVILGIESTGWLLGTLFSLQPRSAIASVNLAGVVIHPGNSYVALPFLLSFSLLLMVIVLIRLMSCFFVIKSES